jgi:DUF177 domain-containing protein
VKVSVAPLLKQPVGDRVDLHVAEDPIDPRGENAGLLDADITSVDADIRATHTDPGALLQGDVHAVVAQQCVRCLKPVGSLVDTSFAEQYYATLQVESGSPMPASPLDAKTIGSDFLIDLTPLIREEVILATPQAPLCRPDCKGLCPTCGLDLNESPHEHEQGVDERWGQLARLKELRVEEGDVKD